MTGTAIAYAMSDLAPGENTGAGTVSVPEDKGGCGHEHHIKVNDDQRPYIDCPVCAAYLPGHVYGWSNTPNGVPLTPDEQGEVEISKRDGETSYRLAMKAMGDAVGQIVQGGRSANQPAAAPSLAEQLAALSPAEKAQIAEMLAPAPAIKAEASAGVPAPEKPAPAKTPARKPGRPRNTPA